MNKSPCSSMMSMNTPDMVCSGYLNTPAGTTLLLTQSNFLQSMEPQLKTLVSSSMKPWTSSWMQTQRYRAPYLASTNGILLTSDASVSFSPCPTPPSSQLKFLAVPVTCRANYISNSWSNPLVLKASATLSSILPQVLSGCSLTCMNRRVVEFMTLVPAEAPCSFTPKNFSIH